MVGLAHVDLQNMIDGRAPLGVGLGRWEEVAADIFSAFREAGLDDGQLQLKIGGSSVGCFSSKLTTLKKKHFPPDEENLVQRIESHLNGMDKRQVNERIGHSIEMWRKFGLCERPRSPWWGALHRLGIEDQPDVDIQVYHPEIDRAILGDHGARQEALESQRKDRWNLWPQNIVEMRFPELHRLQQRLDTLPELVHLEYLALEEGRYRMAERTDWMPVNRPT